MPAASVTGENAAGTGWKATLGLEGRVLQKRKERSTARFLQPFRRALCQWREQGKPTPLPTPKHGSQMTAREEPKQRLPSGENETKPDTL